MERDDESEAHARALSRVDPRWDAARTERALAGMHRRRARRRASMVLAASTMLLALVLVSWRFEDATPASEARAAAGAIDRVVHLADGSRVTPDEGAAVVVEHVSDDRVLVRIDRGAADLDVVPGLPRRFEVRAGDVTVRVIGTAFRVERLVDDRVRVSVERGHVEVAWPAGRGELLAGQEGLYPPPFVAAAATTVVTTPVEDSAATEAPTEAPAREVTAARGRPTWRTLALAARYDDAYVALGTPGDRASAVGDDVEDLLLAADVARLSGHPAEALPWLTAVERDHATDPRAVLATFTRGRLLMELGRAADAAEALEHVIAMEPSGSLAEDALARAALAESAAGHTARAEALASRYLAEHPAGRWASRVSAIANDGR